MKNLVNLVLAFFISQFSYGQLSFLDSNYTAAFSADPELDGDVKFVSSTYLYTVSEDFPHIDNFTIGKFNLADMDNVWHVDFDKKWNFEGLELRAKSIHFDDDGTIRIFARCLDKKVSIYKLFVQIISPSGNKNELVHLIDIPVELNKSFGSLKTIQLENHFFTCHILDYNDERIIQGIWIDKNLKVERIIYANAENDEVEIKELIDAKDMASVYVLAKGPTRYINNRVIEPSRGLYRFSLEDEETENISLQFKDFKIFENHLALDTINNKLLFMGLSGINKTNTMNSTTLIRIDMKDWKIEKTSFNPISEGAIQEIVRSGKIYGSANKNSPKVQFQDPIFRFCADGTYYVVFENGESNPLFNILHYGHYILKFDQNDKLLWDRYVADYGMDNAKLNVVENSLVISTILSGKILQELYPENPSFVNLTKDNEVLLRITMNDPLSEFEVIMIANSEDQPAARFHLDTFENSIAPFDNFVSFYRHKRKLLNKAFVHISPK